MSFSVENRGSSSIWVVGSSVLQRRPKNRCAGLVPMPSDGVLRQSKSARY